MPFSSLILITLAYVSPQGGVRINTAQFENARSEDAHNQPDFLGDYTFAFCNRMIAPRKVYLSFTKWNQRELLAGLAGMKIPVHVILGTADTSLMSNQWPERLQSAGANVRFIEGAGHFFSSEHLNNLLQAFVSLSDAHEDQQKHK